VLEVSALSKAKEKNARQKKAKQPRKAKGAVAVALAGSPAEDADFKEAERAQDLPKKG
jgi:hypothetical protein